jgi:prepilin-type N-terminal cleavage/methylation domain-containing protein
MNRRDRGFTLLEVLVALAIAAGALVLVAGAVATSERRSVKAEVEARLEREVESVLSAWTGGLESHYEGKLAGFDGYRWSVRLAPEPDGVLRRLQRVHLTVVGAAGEQVLVRDVLLHGGPGIR